MTPRADEQGYDFSEPTRFDKLFTGMTLEPAPDYNSRRGFEDMSPEDTFDGDDGRLLERRIESASKSWRPQRDRPTLTVKKA